MAKSKRKKRVRFPGPTMLKFVQKVEDRRDNMPKVIALLKKGGTAVDYPGFKGLTPLEAARRVQSKLDIAAKALREACPNPLDNTFVIEVDSTGKRG